MMLKEEGGEAWVSLGREGDVRVVVFVVENFEDFADFENFVVVRAVSLMGVWVRVVWKKRRRRTRRGEVLIDSNLI